MVEQPWTRFELRRKLIEAAGIDSERFDGMTLEQIVVLVGEVNVSLRQQLEYQEQRAEKAEEKVRDQEADLRYLENLVQGGDL